MGLVEITSSQMYSGLLVLQGILLSIVCISLNVSRGQACHILLVFCRHANCINDQISRPDIYHHHAVLPFNHVICNLLEKISALRFGRCVSIASCRSSFSRDAIRSYLPISSALRIGFNDLAMPDSGFSSTTGPSHISSRVLCDQRSQTIIYSVAFGSLFRCWRLLYST